MAFKGINNGHQPALELATVEGVSSLGLKRWGWKAQRRDEGIRSDVLASLCSFLSLPVSISQSVKGNWKLKGEEAH